MSDGESGNRLSIIMVQPVPRATLRSKVVAHLFDAILRRELRPGERIVEAKLARRLGVAQSTLREALQQLEHQGLVTKHENRGTFITRLTAEDIEGIYVVRLELEPLAAFLARQKWTPDHQARLTELLQEMREASERRDFEELLKKDLAFHQFIWRSSGNRALERALNAVCPSIFAGYLMFFMSGDTYDFAEDYREHQTLLAAFERGSPEEVRKIFREMTEVFRVQDVHNLRALSAEETPAASASGTIPP
jgi:DNA-binding GntR family transcriptional regulator